MSDVAIIGMGNVGLALAARLAATGHRVVAGVETDDARRAALQGTGRLRLSGHLGDVEVAMPCLTADHGAVADAEIVFVATAADAFAEVAASVVRPAGTPQTFVLMTDYVAGVERFAAALPVAASDARVYAFGSSPWLCAGLPTGEVVVAGAKSWVEVIGQTDDDAARGVESLRRFFPQAVAARQQTAAALNNSNPVAHIPSWLIHADTAAGRDAVGSFHLPDFDTPGVIELRLALDRERMQVMDALGIGAHALSRMEFNRRSYGPADRIAALPRIGPTFQRRFVTEDVPYGLAPIEALAGKTGVAVPVISSVLDAVEQRERRDHRPEGARAAALAWERIRADRTATPGEPVGAAR